MALLVPNLQASPTFDAQAIPDSTDLAAQIAASAAVATGVVSGCGVSPQGSPNMTVQVAAGSVVVAGTPVTVAAVTSLSIAAADATDRRDIVVVNSSGVVSVVKGTDCGTAGWTRTTPNPLTSSPPPVKPAIPANSLLLGEVYVAASTTSIASGNIIDKTTPSNIFVSSAGPLSITNTPTGSNQVLTSTGTGTASWQAPTVNSTSALKLALTDTISYPPPSPLRALSVLYMVQNPTLTGLPPVTGATWAGGLITLTFASSIAGPLGSTLGQVGDTFPIYTENFAPSGYNVGNSLAAVTATITSATTATIPQATTTGTVTVIGTAQPLPEWYSVFGGAPRGLQQIEGTYTQSAPPSNLYGIGPIVQASMAFIPGNPITATFTISNASNNATLTGTPPAGLFVGMNVVDTTNPSYIPANTIVGAISYNIGSNTTTITLINKVSTAAVTPSNSSTDTLSFVCDLLTAEEFVAGAFTLGYTTQPSYMVPPNFIQDVPGLAQGWDLEYWSGPVFGNIKNVKSSQFSANFFAGHGTEAPLRIGFQFADSTYGSYASTALGQVGMEIGATIGYMNNGYTFSTNSASNSTALSGAGTLHMDAPNTLSVANVMGLIPGQGTFVIEASDGIHTGTYTGVSGSTLTGCVYSGSQAATLYTGGLIVILPTWLPLHNSQSNVGILNAGVTANPTQVPATTIASGSNNKDLATLGSVTGTCASSVGSALSALSTFPVTSATNFGTSGLGVLKNSTSFYVFSWTGNTYSGGVNTLTGCVFTGLQSTVLTGSPTVFLNGLLAVNSVQWFPDGGGFLGVDGQFISQLMYSGTTGTYVGGTATATALSSLSTLTVVSTAMLPVAGTGTLYTSGGPQTVTWTGIGSATTLTGCTYSGSTANTVINGSQLFLASTTTGPANMPAAAFIAVQQLQWAQDFTVETGMAVLALPGPGFAVTLNGLSNTTGVFQGVALPSSTATPICIGPGFQLPQPTTTKMAVFAQAAATNANALPLFQGLNPYMDGTEVKIVVSRATNSSTITLTSNGTSSGTLLSLGAGTRALATGGSIVLGWDSNSRTSGEWIEYASNLGGHG